MTCHLNSNNGIKFFGRDNSCKILIAGLRILNCLAVANILLLAIIQLNTLVQQQMLGDRCKECYLIPVISLLVLREWVFSKQNIYHDNDTADTLCQMTVKNSLLFGKQPFLSCKTILLFLLIPKVLEIVWILFKYMLSQPIIKY